MGAANSASNTSFSRCLPLPVSFFDPPIPSRGFLIIFHYFLGKKSKGDVQMGAAHLASNTSFSRCLPLFMPILTPPIPNRGLLMIFLFLDIWPHLYFLNYRILWKFTRILFCAESVFNHKKQWKKANILNKSTIFAIFLILWVKTEKNAKKWNKFYFFFIFYD